MKYETDSRKVQPGQIFVAIKGHTVDGHDYITNAVDNGAIRVIAEKEVTAGVPVEVVPSTEEYLKRHLKEDYAEEINKLQIIGITGTNGKTTSAYLTYQLLNLLGIDTAYLGTIGYKYHNKSVELDNTTPDILTIYKILLELAKAKCHTLVMEVSSHALSYERIYGINLKIAAFTNLTEDHLDYHKTMENYLKEKLKIIDYLSSDGTLIVNGDDEASKKFIKKNNNEGITLGFNEKFNYKIVDANIAPDHTDIKFIYEKEEYNVTTHLTSKFNVYNYMTALAIVHALNISIEDIIEKTGEIKPPKGRCEVHKVNGGYAVIDYAHTPDAVEKVISAYNELKTGKLITIVGCGGDRDPYKRPIMSDIACSNSDWVIITNDNPRSENPNNIVSDMLHNLDKFNYEIILNRKNAIIRGIQMLDKNDILLVLGKGHENYQIINNKRYNFDDKEVVLENIN